MSNVGRTLRNAILVGILLVGACQTKKKEPQAEPPPVQPANPEAESAIEQVAEQQRLESEFSDVMYRQRFQQAVAWRDQGEFQKALDAVQDALNYSPSSDEALKLRSELQRSLGERAGEVGTVIEDQAELSKVRLEEQKVNIRRHLSRAQEMVGAKDYDGAQRAYEDAQFIVTTSPIRGDTELTELGTQAETGLRDLDRIRAEESKEQERRDTEKALREIAAQQERAELEARDRRAKLLSTAIDKFNQEDFDQAEEYAGQVLAEEPDNTVAIDIRENSRRARHEMINERLLRDMKDSFRRWQVEIEETKVPYSSILQWPSQSFWDKISRLRAMRSLTGTERELTPEEQNVINIVKTRTIDLAFQQTQFPQVVDYLTAASSVNFVIDARAREDLAAVEINLQVNNVTVRDALELIMAQASADKTVVYEVVGNVVRFIKKEHQKKEFVLQIHPVADLTLGLTDFIPPDITQVGVSEDTEAPIFGGQAEEAPQPYGTIDELAELVRNSAGAEAWEQGGTISPQGKNLVVYNSPEVQQKIARFLDDLRAFSGVVVTIESRFLTVSDKFLRDVGVDFRGLGGTNGGPLAVLDDVTSGLDDNASAAIDNGGPGVGSGGAASAPSSGLFFNDGADGDFRTRTENIFTSALGQTLSALGGGTFQITYLDDVNISAIIRAVEKYARFRELTAPSLTVYNTQRAHITVVNQISYVQDFDVEVAQTAFIADPVIGVIQDGLTLSVRPTVSNDRQFITLELRPKVVNLVTPIATFQTLLGAAIAVVSAQNPVTIQLPELDIRVVESTVRIPDGGSILLGGLKDISVADKKSTSPILGNIPILSFLFTRQGKSEEIEHLMIVVTATITDLQEQMERYRG